MVVACIVYRDDQLQWRDFSWIWLKHIVVQNIPRLLRYCRLRYPNCNAIILRMYIHNITLLLSCPLSCPLSCRYDTTQDKDDLAPKSTSILGV